MIPGNVTTHNGVRYQMQFLGALSISKNGKVLYEHWWAVDLDRLEEVEYIDRIPVNRRVRKRRKKKE